MKPYLPICPPIPTQPADWTLDKSFSPAYVQPKLNGVRAMISPDGHIYKKSGDECPALRDKYGAPGHWIDGELWHPDMTLEEIAGLVNRAEVDDQVAKLQFWAFDLIHNTLPQGERFDSLLLISQLNRQKFQIIETHYTEDPLDAKALFNRYSESSSCDGMIYRTPNATYKFGKTSAVLKRKRELDGEYKCIGVTMGMGKFFDMLGSFQLIDSENRQFSCGGGNLTVADRTAMWKNPPIGEMIQVRYPYISKNGIPQCPQFVRIRKDMAI